MSKKIRRKIRDLAKEEGKRHKRRLRALMGRNGMWPLNAPGMPPPGPNFLAHAEAIGDDTVFNSKKGHEEYKPGEELRKLYQRALREAGFTMPVQIKPGYKADVKFIPGHIWGQYAEEWAHAMANPGSGDAPRVDGPHPADVMVIGKMPWHEETQELRNLVGATGQIMMDMINKLHIKGAAKWYVTNLCKFKPPDETSKIKKAWEKDCLPLLHQELRIVRPKYILCVGADASKALLGAKYGVGYMEGRVVQYDFPVHASHEDEPEIHRAQVMTVLHPAEVARSPDKARVLERGMARFALLVTGVNFDKAEDDIDHRMIDTYEDAVEWVEEMEHRLQQKKPGRRFVSWDAEWEGQHPMNEGSYLRLIQLSCFPKSAVAFKISHVGGKPAFRDRDGKPALKRLAKLLNKFMLGKRAVGSFLVSDLEWLNYYDFYPTADCDIPLDPLKTKQGTKAAWERLRDGEGWVDIAAALHSIEETASLGLESIGMRYTTAPRWDIALEDWKKEYCKAHDLKSGALEGYGNCPDKILHPYGCYDADVTLRAWYALEQMLHNDYEGNCCWEPFWETMIALPVILEMHQNGITVDRKRIDVLTEAFLTARYSQEEKIRHYARWPDFNIRSTQHVKEFLFGEKLNGKFDKAGKRVKIRPPGAISLYVEPLLDTSKPPRRWSDLKERGIEKEATPGTGKQILAILAQENDGVADAINMLRDYRFLDQVLKSLLRPPKEEEDGAWATDDEGFYEYEAGLAYCIDSDGRVRTHLYPTAETGRWKSARPNLQNISKSRDPDYVRLLGGKKDESGNWVGGNYIYKLRSILMAAPGYALVEFDYKGAELFVMAIMSGDVNMIEHAERALYPDEGYDEKGRPCKGGKFPHPKYYDIHSNVAVLAFNLKCAPTKKGLKDIGKSHFRTLAKNVIFGIAYGRGAKAIALQAKENAKKGDPEVTVEQAQAVIDAIFEMYPNLKPFFAEAEERALKDKWLCHCFGRFRRFPNAADYKLEGEFSRQAMNFPIQGAVASAVNRGLARIRKVVHDQGLQNEIKLLLQIHDAGLLEVRYDYLEYVVDELIPYAMRDCVPIFPTTLDGEPTGKGPYYLGIDTVVENHWGEKFTLEECCDYGIPTRFAASSSH
jgi:uracil-DNA glycosylase family 4